MNKLKTVFLCVIIEIMVIICVGCANLCPKPLYYFFYNILYGIMFSFLLPLFLLRKEENVPVFIGLKTLGKRQMAVIIIVDVFSVGGQLISAAVDGRIIPWNLLPMGAVPLIMTTFFEEFLFRGFFQNKFEKEFGVLPAVFISGFLFSLYHLGYPGFRTAGDITLLAAVGVGFAAAYKLSGNHLIAAYFVNLPNAFVTYMLKFEQFPVMDMSSTIAGILTVGIIAVVLLCLGRLLKRSSG